MLGFGYFARAPIREKYNLLAAQNNPATIPDKMHSICCIFLVVGCLEAYQVLSCVVTPVVAFIVIIPNIHRITPHLICIVDEVVMMNSVIVAGIVKVDSIPVVCYCVVAYVVAT